MRCNSPSLGLRHTTPVGIFPNGASPEGCLDKAGNVWEWTRSRYAPYPYDPADGREDLASGDEVRRVLRGGSFAGDHDYVRCAARNHFRPHSRGYNIGFRCVVSIFSSAR